MCPPIGEFKIQLPADVHPGMQQVMDQVLDSLPLPVPDFGITQPWTCVE